MSCNFIFYGLTMSADVARDVIALVRKHPVYMNMHSETGHAGTGFTAYSSYNADSEPSAFYYYIDEMESGYTDMIDSICPINVNNLINATHDHAAAIAYIDELDDYIHEHLKVKTNVGWFMVSCDFEDSDWSESSESSESTNS